MVEMVTETKGEHQKHNQGTQNDQKCPDFGTNDNISE